jgi:hypothetical protein
MIATGRDHLHKSPIGDVVQFTAQSYTSRGPRFAMKNRLLLGISLSCRERHEHSLPLFERTREPDRRARLSTPIWANPFAPTAEYRRSSEGAVGEDYAAFLQLERPLLTSLGEVWA